MTELRHRESEMEIERWMFHGPDHNIHVCEEGDPNMRVCFMTSTGPTVKRARLIAAAPDLLAELKTSYCPGDFTRTVEECMASRECGCSSGAAVAKATEPRP